MKPMTQEWTNKAEAALASARRELNVSERPNYDAVCILALHAVEKYIKARLEESGAHYPGTQNLEILMDLVCPVEPDWEKLREQAGLVKNYGLRAPFPGYTASLDVARGVVMAANDFREAFWKSQEEDMELS